MLNTQRSLLDTIKKRKLTYFGHIIRKNNIQRLVLEGKINGRHGRGRPRTNWTDNIKDWTQMRYHECIRLAQDGKKWKFMTANLLRADGTWDRENINYMGKFWASPVKRVEQCKIKLVQFNFTTWHSFYTLWHYVVTMLKNALSKSWRIIWVPKMKLPALEIGPWIQWSVGVSHTPVNYSVVSSSNLPLLSLSLVDFLYSRSLRRRIRCYSVTGITLICCIYILPGADPAKNFMGAENVSRQTTPFFRPRL